MEQDQGSETVDACAPACAAQALLQFLFYRTSGKKKKKKSIINSNSDKASTWKECRDTAICNSPEQQ